MKIKQIGKNDIIKVALLHKKALPQTVSSRLGEFYLRSIYEAAINDKNTKAFIAMDKGAIAGAVVATTNLSSFQSQVKSQLFARGYFDILIALLKRVSLIADLAKRISFERKLLREYNGKYATFVILFTVKQFREKGIGTKLVKEVLKQYKNNTKNIYVDTLVENKPAKNLYESLGFKTLKKIDDSCLFLLQKKNV